MDEDFEVDYTEESDRYIITAENVIRHHAELDPAGALEIIIHNFKKMTKEGIEVDLLNLHLGLIDYQRKAERTCCSDSRASWSTTFIGYSEGDYDMDLLGAISWWFYKKLHCYHYKCFRCGRDVFIKKRKGIAKEDICGKCAFIIKNWDKVMGKRCGGKFECYKS